MLNIYIFIYLFICICIFYFYLVIVNLKELFIRQDGISNSASLVKFMEKFFKNRYLAVFLLLYILISLSFLFTSVAGESEEKPITHNFKCRRNGCCDQHEWCRFWASVGECTNNKDWMEDNCQLACNTCPKSGLFIFLFFLFLYTV